MTGRAQNSTTHQEFLRDEILGSQNRNQMNGNLETKYLFGSKFFLGFSVENDNHKETSRI
jgi:hypothetical protein